ncbi:MAG: hypothetical protein AABY10_05415 [Nanoarchaeota archaeon]
MERCYEFTFPCGETPQNNIIARILKRRGGKICFSDIESREELNELGGFKGMHPIWQQSFYFPYDAYDSHSYGEKGVRVSSKASQEFNSSGIETQFNVTISGYDPIEPLSKSLDEEFSTIKTEADNGDRWAGFTFPLLVSKSDCSHKYLSHPP